MGLAFLIAATLITIGLLSGLSFADTSASSHYQFIETDLGGGGLVPSSSAHYQSALSLGDNAIGNSASTNYQIEAGSQTTRDPILTVGINNTNANFGAFSPTTTATASASFSVIDYTSYGYTVQIAGNTPSYRGHSLPGMTTTGPPVTGTEQFGINLVKNTSPAVGADPAHGPFAVGSASTNYNTPNNFRYVPGETIASAPKSSGQTTYTISYVADVTSITPGGQYTGGQIIIVTATY